MIAVVNKSMDAVCWSTLLPYIEAALPWRDETPPPLPPPPPLHSGPFHLLRQVCFSHPFNLDGSFHTSVCSLPPSPAAQWTPSLSPCFTRKTFICRRAHGWWKGLLLAISEVAECLLPSILTFFPHPAPRCTPITGYFSLSPAHFSDVTKVIWGVLWANASLILCTYSRRWPVSLPASSGVKSWLGWIDALSRWIYLSPSLSLCFFLILSEKLWENVESLNSSACPHIRWYFFKMWLYWCHSFSCTTRRQKAF